MNPEQIREIIEVCMTIGAAFLVYAILGIKDHFFPRTQPTIQSLHAQFMREHKPRKQDC